VNAAPGLDGRPVGEGQGGAGHTAGMDPESAVACVAETPAPASRDRCPFRLVLERDECSCPKTGPHDVHTYRTRSGVKRQFTIVEAQ